MGTVAKLLYKQLISCLALRAITTRIPHRPSAVAVHSGNRVDFSYACGRCKHSFPFRAGCQFVPHPPTRHCIPPSFFASTSAPRDISIPFLTPYIPFQQSYPCHFPTHFQRLPSFQRRVYPKTKLKSSYRRNCLHCPQSPTKKLKTKINT